MRRMVSGLVLAAFAAGYLCGMATTTPAEAQMGDLMKGAAKSGALGSVGELGSSIVSLQEHVDGLQKNIDVLKKVKTALGG